MNINDNDLKPKTKAIITLLLVSLVVRLAILFPIIKLDVPAKYDEKTYYERAESYQSIYKDLIAFKTPDPADKKNAYKRGVWPPFHPMLLGFLFLIVGKSVAAARIFIAIISALTTILVFLFTTKLADRKTGIAAALIHIFYPPFIAFSHYLWSETLFIFLLFLALYLAAVIPAAETSKKRILLSLLLGIALGLSVITRAAALLFLIIIPVWVILNLKIKREKIIIPLLIIITVLLVIFPWEYTLVSREKRFAFLTNYSSRNLYMGNNEFVRQKLDYDLHDLEYLPYRALRKYAKQNSLHIEAAARELAVKEIKSHFGAFIKRAFSKFLLLWPINSYPMRYLFEVVYPPMSSSLLQIIIFIFVISYILFSIFAVKGIFAGEMPLKHIILILSLVIAGMAPYIIAASHTRYNLPQVALLLPLAGVGLVHFKKKIAWTMIIAAITICASLALSFYAYKNYLYKVLHPSSYYRQTVSPLDKLFKKETTLVDAIELTANGPAHQDLVTLTILNDGNYSFKRDKNEKTIQVNLKQKKLIDIFSVRPQETLFLKVHSAKQRKAALINPISPNFWYKSQPIMGNISLSWAGGH